MKRLAMFLLITMLLFTLGCSSLPSQDKGAIVDNTAGEDATNALANQKSDVPSEPSSQAKVTIEIKKPEAQAQVPIEEPIQIEEKLPKGYAKLGMSDSSDAIEIKDWGIEVGPKQSAKLVNMTFLIRNTHREAIYGQILFEAWEDSVFLKKMYSLDGEVPSGQSYIFTEYVDQSLDAPKQQKQMRAVLIDTKAGKTLGEDHVFFVPISK